MDTSLPPGALPEPKARLSSVVTAIGLLKAFYESDIEIGTSALGGGLNRSTQHFILKGKMECGDGSGISSRIYNGREDGVMGSLAARRVA
jgi:hypothetical protein